VPFKKGEGGRPRGATNKASREIKDVADGLLSDPAYVTALKRRLISGKAPHMETLLHHYRYGKPAEQHTGTFTHLHKVYAWQD